MKKIKRALISVFDKTNLKTLLNSLKKNKIEFQDLLYQNPRQAGGQTGAGNVIPTGVEMGNGTKVVSTAKIFTQGQLTQTSEKMDVAIDGVGFFQVAIHKDLIFLLEGF